MANAGKGRVHIKDLVDKTAEQDPAYQKAVKEILEQNPKSGWLIGRGAFDRQDLQYLSDFKDAERQKEHEMREVESFEFALLRSRTEAEPGVASQGSGEVGASSASVCIPGPGGQVLRVAVKEKQDIRPVAKLLPTVRVLSARDDSLAPALQSPQGVLPPSPVPTAGTPSGGLTGMRRQGSQDQGGGSRPAGVGPLESDPVMKRQRSGDVRHASGAAAGSAVLSSSGEAGGAPGLQPGGSQNGTQGEGLQGLLGGYGTSSDDEEPGAGAAPQQPQLPAVQGSAGVGHGIAPGTVGRVKLPNAAELLGLVDDEPAPVFRAQGPLAPDGAAPQAAGGAGAAHGTAAEGGRDAVDDSDDSGDDDTSD